MQFRTSGLIGPEPLPVVCRGLGDGVVGLRLGLVLRHVREYLVERLKGSGARKAVPTADLVLAPVGEDGGPPGWQHLLGREDGRRRGVIGHAVAWNARVTQSIT